MNTTGRRTGRQGIPGRVMNTENLRQVGAGKKRKEEKEERKQKKKEHGTYN